MKGMRPDRPAGLLLRTKYGRRYSRITSMNPIFAVKVVVCSAPLASTGSAVLVPHTE